MSIITISRGSYSRGREVAEKLADRLQYTCVSRDVLLEASEEFNVTELRLIRALHDSPSALERFRHGKVRFISYIRSALLEHVKKGNVVYHGLAGHYLLRDIPGVLKVRINASMEGRVKEEMERENISAEKALYILKKDDEERRKWGLQVCGTDTWDSRLYDIVLKVNSLTINDAVDVLYDLVQKPAFQRTEETQRILCNAALAAKVQAELVKYSPNLKVIADDGIITLSEVGDIIQTDRAIRDKVENLSQRFGGIKEVIIREPLKSKKDHVNPFLNLDI